MRPLLLLLSILFCLDSYCQESRADSAIAALANELHVDSLRLYHLRHRAFDFQFDNRNSFIRNRAISIDGINVGIVVDRRFRYGLGIYRVHAPFQKFKSSKPSSVNDADDETDRELDMYFAMPNFKYMFIYKKWIHASAEVAIGFGMVNYSITNLDESSFVKKYGTFIPAGSGIEVILIPYRYLGVGGSIGYRKSLKTYDINADFDGMYYSYGVNVFVGLIFKDIRYKSWKRNYFQQVQKIRHSRG